VVGNQNKHDIFEIPKKLLAIILVRILREYWFHIPKKLYAIILVKS
jgi:hypothetical protein